jgi:hypothetical protein
MSGAPLYDLLHLQQVSSKPVHILIGVKGVMVDVFNSGAGVEGELTDFDNGGDSPLSYLSNVHAAGHKIFEGLAETSHDKRVFVDAYTCGSCFVGNVVHCVADLGHGNG